MFIEIVESLRCPNVHAVSSLVGVFRSVDGRDVVAGVLGCPICHAEYEIRDGVVWFGGLEGSEPQPEEAAREEEAMRIAAFLDLTEPSGFAVLHGLWAIHAPIVSGLTAMHLVLLDPSVEIARAPGITIIRAGEVVPISVGRASAVAIDAGADPGFAAALVACVRPGGRVIGPTTLPVPSGARELTRDARCWIAERDGGGPLMSLSRRSGATA